MPMIHIEYDNTKVTDEDIIKLADAIQKIVSTATQIEDVFVYANSAHIKLKIAPLEIFIQMSAHKITDRETLFNAIKVQLADWNLKNKFQHPLNLTLIPMEWKFETGI